MNVKIIKLITGEELILDLHGRQNCSILDGAVLAATSVHAIQLARDPSNGQLVRQFVEWPMMATPGQIVEIPVSAVVTAPLDPYEELAREFTSAVTGLDLPQTPKILVG